MTSLHSKHQKVSGGFGSAPLKKDDYAKGPVPRAMRGTKTGKTPKVGYSGPSAATGDFK